MSGAESRQHVVLITAKVPPIKDGVGDYTYHLGRELSKKHRVSIVTTRGQREDGDGDHFRVLPVVSRWDAWGMSQLFALLKTLQPSLINVQWVPFLWDKRGINFALPLTVLRLRQAGYRVLTTVHEPYVPFDTWSRLLMGPLQRLELWLLILGSAKVTVTTSAWARMFQRLFPWRQHDIFWLPVGSNIPKIPLSAGERTRFRQQLGLGEKDILLAAFNPLGAGKIVELIGKTWQVMQRHRKSAKLALIGCQIDDLKSRCCPEIWNDGVLCTGYLAPADVSRWLSCADLFLAPFIDGVSARRTSVITAMEHELPVVTMRGRLTEQQLFEDSPLVLVDVHDEDGFIAAAEQLAADEEARTSLRDATVWFYQHHFSWSLIADRLMKECLDNEPRAAPVAAGDSITMAHDKGHVGEKETVVKAPGLSSPCMME